MKVIRLLLLGAVGTTQGQVDQGIDVVDVIRASATVTKVDPANNGKYIVIDVNSADYAVGDDYLALSKAVRARHPEAELAILRIGHRTVGRIGARVRPA